MTTSTTDAEAIREAFAKIVVEADRDWNGNVAGYRKYLVDRLTDCGLFVLASRREAQEPVAWRVTYADGETVYLRHKPSGDSGVYECAPLYTAPPADAGMREAFVRVLASLAAAISILERTPKAKKAVASDKMFDTMLDDYRKALEAGRAALTAPGATTKSDVEALAATTAERPGTVTSEPEPSTSDPSSTYTIAHDGFTGTVQGHYVTREGKQGVVLQQVGTRVVHVYGRKWLDGDTASDPSSTRSEVTVGISKDTLLSLISALDRATGDTDPSVDPDSTDEEVRREYPVFWVCQQLSALLDQFEIRRK